MKSKLKQLKFAAQQTMQKSKNLSTFRQEIKKAFGSSIRLNESIVEISKSANKRLECLERSGGHVIRMPTTLLVKLAKHNSPDVRELAARLLPERIVAKLANDKSSNVRAQVAKRTSLNVLSEMSNKFSNDDELQTIKRQRFLTEVFGDITPLNVDSKATGDVVKTQVLDLSDSWYKNQARKLLDDYGEFTVTPVAIEKNWNPLAVKRFCDSMRLSNNVEIDQDKLQDAVDSLIDDLSKSREESYGFTMKEVKQQLRNQLEQETILETPVIPILSEEQENIVLNLLENSVTNVEYLRLFESIFSVKKSVVPSAIKKYHLGEGLNEDTLVPMKAIVPNSVIDENTELALDKYVKIWNSRQNLFGEAFKLNWQQDTMQNNQIGFDLEII